jgi:peroxiredoxin
MHTFLLPLLLTAVGSQPDTDRIGLRIEDFNLRDCKGKEHRLSDWKDRKLIVVVFLSANCPLAKLYGPRLAELARIYDASGVAIVGIHANQHEGPTDLARYAREHHISFPLLRDVGNVVADRFGARRTPEAFILDEGRVIRYHGRIDGQYDVGLQRPTEARRDLIEALEELLAGKPVSQPATEAVGCLIGRTPRQGKGSVTYAKDIAPILQNRCQQCHRPGQIGPFALTSYADAVGNSATMREVVESGRMPPWGANPKHGRFANDPTLSAAEKKLLLDWIDADCPEGDPADLPPLRFFSDDWNMPHPDLVLSIPQPYTVPAEGLVEYQSFNVDPGFTEDRWVQDVEIRPGNRAVVHHCSIFLKPPGAKGPVPQGQLESFMLAGMAPGTPHWALPDGFAQRIPAGWHIVFEIHYVTIGSEQTDQTAIALKFADARTVHKEVATRLMFSLDMRIPPHEPNFEIGHTWQMNADVLLLAMFPHMHLRGKAFRYEVRYPNGETEILLDVPRYDFNWQHRYVLAEPLRLPAGSRLTCTAHYDNSSANAANPDPSVWVDVGPQSQDEMFNGYYEVVLADQDLTRPIPWHTALWAKVRPIFSLRFSLAIALVCGFYLVGRRTWRRRQETKGDAEAGVGDKLSLSGK